MLRNLTNQEDEERVTLRSSLSRKRHVIINPASAGGRTRAKVSRIVKVLDDHFGRSYSLDITRKPGEASLFARQAVRNGSRLVVAVGGDGTIQEVVNGFFRDGKAINFDCELGIINCGTGGGFCQSLGLPGKLEMQLKVLMNGNRRLVDIGRAIFYSPEGLLQERLFLNECQAGIGAAVVQSVQSRHKRLGGLAAFGLAALEKAIRHPARQIKVTVADKLLSTGPLIGIVIANGRYAGGGMSLAPKARPDDGLLDILLIHDQPLVRRLWNFPKIYSGRHIACPEFTYSQATHVLMESEESSRVEADGELIGCLPCRVDVIPSALKVKTFDRKGGKNL